MTEVLYQPSAAAIAATNLSRYMAGVGFESYADAWRWSVDDLDAFWASMWDFFDVQGTRGTTVLADRTMPGAAWFPEAELNYAEQALRWDDDRPAVEFRSEPGGRPPETISHRELRRRVAEVAAGLRGLGVGRGDRVAAYAPNIPETLIAFLATASLGAIWSSCSPDFGVTAVLDRFRQIEPKVLLAADGYGYRGTVYDRRPEVDELRRSLPSVEAVVTVANVGLPVEGLSFDDLAAAGAGAALAVERVPFGHPLWVLYSSGHDRLTQGPGPRPRRHRPRAPQGVVVAPRPRPRRPVLLVLLHRLDDVEPAGGRAAGGRHRGPLRRKPGHARPGCPVADGGGHGRHLLRGERGLPPVVHEGRDRPPRGGRPVPAARARVDRRAAHA